MAESVIRGSTIAAILCQGSGQPADHQVSHHASFDRIFFLSYCVFYIYLPASLPPSLSLLIFHRHHLPLLFFLCQTLDSLDHLFIHSLSLCVSRLNHFDFVKADDLERIGMSKPAIRRLLDAVKKKKQLQKKRSSTNLIEKVSRFAE